MMRRAILRAFKPTVRLGTIFLAINAVIVAWSMLVALSSGDAFLGLFWLMYGFTTSATIGLLLMWGTERDRRMRAEEELMALLVTYGRSMLHSVHDSGWPESSDGQVDDDQ